MAGLLDKSLPSLATNLLKKLGATPIYIEVISYSYDLETGETTSNVVSVPTTGYISRPTYQEIDGSAGLITDDFYKVYLPAEKLPIVRVKDKIHFDNIYHDVMIVEVIRSGAKPALQILFVKQCENVSYQT